MKVSVIVTCYNKGEFIGECLKSIFKQNYKQNYKQIQLIIINDGSTDSSDKVIKSTIVDSPFRETNYLCKPNQGVIAARNEGIEQANGEALLFVDGDDFLDEDFIQVMVNEMIKNDVQIVGCPAWDFTNKKYQNFYDKEFDIRDMLTNNIINASSLVRKEAIGEIRFDDNLKNCVMEDYDFWLNLILNNDASVWYSRKIKLNYRILSNGRSRSNNRTKKFLFYKNYMKKYSNKISRDDFKFILKHQNLKMKVFFLILRMVYK